MPTEPIQQFLLAFEFSLLLAGAWLAFRLLAQPARRQHWLGINRLAPWPITLAEFGLYILMFLFFGLIVQTGLRLALGHLVSQAPDRAGLEVFVYGTGVHGGALLGWLLFPFVRRQLYTEYGTAPSPVPPPPRLLWRTVLATAGSALLTLLPLLVLISFAWTLLLRRLGLPDEPQDLIAVFANTRSPWVIAGMLLVACVVAPLNEELLFRAGIYRYCRQRLGRPWALLISGLLFGALHGNWAGVLPLGLLGAGFALAYEATGDIRVTVVAHALFNLNTILSILSGLQQ